MNKLFIGGIFIFITGIFLQSSVLNSKFSKFEFDISFSKDKIFFKNKKSFSWDELNIVAKDYQPVYLSDNGISYLPDLKNSEIVIEIRRKNHNIELKKLKGFMYWKTLGFSCSTFKCNGRIDESGVKSGLF